MPEDSPLYSFKLLAHLFVLASIVSLALVVLVDAAMLLWSAGPVGEAARLGLGRGVLFLLLPYPVGDAEWTGVGALALGCGLLIFGLVLFWVNRRGLYRGLSGPGTRIFALTTLVSGVMFIAYGAYLAANGHLTEAAVAGNWLPTPVGILVLHSWELSQWHGFLIGAILCSFAYMAIKDGPQVIRAVKRSLKMGTPPTIRTDNTWVLIFRIYLGMLFFYVVYYTILDMFTEPTVPAFGEQPVWRQLYMFAHASVWEEFLSRVLMLGLPLWLYFGIAQRPQPPAWRFLIGGGFKIDTVAFTLIVIQGVVFALAHVSGWDFWKVLPTSISGFFFGYLFLKKGLWAAIVLHFTFDYLNMTYEVFPAAEEPIVLLELVWLVAGGVLVFHFIYVAMKDGPSIVRDALVGRPTEGGGSMPEAATAGAEVPSESAEGEPGETPPHGQGGR